MWTYSLSFHHVGLGDWTHVLELGGRCLYPLTHLTCPISTTFYIKEKWCWISSLTNWRWGVWRQKLSRTDHPLPFQSLAVKAISARALLQLPPTQDFCGSLVKIRAGFPKQQNKTKTTVPPWVHSSLHLLDITSGSHDLSKQGRHHGKYTIFSSPCGFIPHKEATPAATKYRAATTWSNCV